MPRLLQVEELVIDDSFHNYCFQSNEADISFWKEYINLHPTEQRKIDEAKQIILGLHVMLKQEYSGREETKVIPLHNNFSLKKIIAAIASVAVVFICFFIFKATKKMDANKKNTRTEIASTSESNYESVFITGYGEKKTIMLSDNTTLHLNAGSTVRIGKGFGKENRNVYLSGEALFDVTHNASLPFIVHARNYEVKVLGTLFNVKDYPGDKFSETSLLRGKVVLSMENNPDRIILHPNQKAVINNAGNSISLAENKKSDSSATISLHPLSLDNKNNTIIETAWAQNKLEIVNESFAEMKDKLERWYNVKIKLGDDVSKYTYTATFEKESIDQALQALQYANHFGYKIDNNEIIISK